MEPKAFLSSVVLALACAPHPATSATLHVWQGSPSPAAPYTNWATAAHVIQDAVDAAGHGDTVLVTNGVYATGGRSVDGFITNRVAVERAITLMSVNGPEFTIIQGLQVPSTSNGDGAIRCVYLANGASLSGFTLTNGAARKTGNHESELSGGGVWCESWSAVVSNCVLSGNSAALGFGGGAYNGTLDHCTLSGNSAWLGGGGAYYCRLNKCILSGNSAIWGGGTRGATLNNCTLSGNSALLGGGGAYGATLNNCTLSGNSASVIGGGAYGATLNNCTLSGNLANEGGGAWGATLNNCALSGNSADVGGGVWGSTLNNCTLSGNSASRRGGGVDGNEYLPCRLNNCIVYYNTAPDGPNYNFIYCYFRYSCSTPMPVYYGPGNIDAGPNFLNMAAGNFRLAPGSPCIDTGSDFDLGGGTNLSDIITNDLDNNPRPLDGDGDGVTAFDMGAYEFVMEFIPCDAIEELIRTVEESSLDRNRKRPLIASLDAACASFERNGIDAGVNQLSAFQNKVRAQVTRVDAQLADELINAAQKIIDEVTEPVHEQAQRDSPGAPQRAGARPNRVESAKPFRLRSFTPCRVAVVTEGLIKGGA